MIKPCLNCGTLTPNTRCPTCTQTHQATKQTGRWQQRTAYHGNWRRTATQLRNQWINTHGHWCPGLTPTDVPPQHTRAPHPAQDLTIDHRADGTLGVLCRSCNSVKGATNPTHPHTTQRNQQRS